MLSKLYVFFSHVVHVLRGHILPLPMHHIMSRGFFYWLMRVRHGSAGNWVGYQLDRRWIEIFHQEIASLQGWPRLVAIFRLGMTR